jgi:hypothetical protein
MKKDISELHKKLTDYETKLEVLQKNIDNDSEPKAKKIDDLLIKFVKTKSVEQSSMASNTSPTAKPMQTQNKLDDNNLSKSSSNINRVPDNTRPNHLGFSDPSRTRYVGFEHLYMTNLADTRLTPQFDSMTIVTDRYFYDLIFLKTMSSNSILCDLKHFRSYKYIDE